MAPSTGVSDRRRRALFRFCTAVADVALRPFARVEIEPLPEQAVWTGGLIIASNHRSLLDLVVGLAAFRKWSLQPSTFVRADYFRLPLAGRFLRQIGGIPAGRGQGSAAIRDARALLLSGGALAITPEGRIPASGERPDGLAELRPGVGWLAASTGVPILVVGLVNTDSAWPLGARVPRWHLRPGKRPTVRVGTAWLPAVDGATKTQITGDLVGCLRQVLARLES